MDKKPESTPHLEASLAEISQLIDKMEQGDLTLEQSLQSFERGIFLIRECQKTLEEAEQKVQILVQNNNEEVLQPYPVDTQDINNTPMQDEGV